ncbi:hypothetical protein PybrP1_004130 [[Pythium] brassicae (nom. inval.)]|nr:hypothetical protein PybrP1_004130 [[Pythium] brassicae (nom. inval.)]
MPAHPPHPELAAAHFAARKQWDAKLVSLQRGMEHVQRCRDGDACGSSLCHSTRRLMQTYESHTCPSPAAAGADCKVCKLWGFLMARRTQMATIAHLRRPLARAPCAVAAARGRGAATPVFHRVFAAQKEAARRRF